MGWSHSVLIAQALHEHLLDTHTSLRAVDRLSPSADTLLSGSRVLHGVYVDDLFMFSLDSNALEVAQDEYLTAVVALGLPPKPSKVRPCRVLDCIGWMGTKPR
jgi:hypothetical protein